MPITTVSNGEDDQDARHAKPTGARRSIVDALAMPGENFIEFEVPRIDIVSRPVNLSCGL